LTKYETTCSAWLGARLRPRLKERLRFGGAASASTPLDLILLPDYISDVVSTVRERLLADIRELDDLEVRELTSFLRKYRRHDAVARLALKLQADPGFRVPIDLPRKFKTSTPIRGKGAPASTRLVADRS